MKKLNCVRDKIDAVDLKLLKLIARRQRLIAEIMKIKAKDNIPVVCKDREQKMLNTRISAAAKLGVPEDVAVDLTKLLLKASKRQQRS